MTYKYVDIDLDDFSDEDLMDEVESRGLVDVVSDQEVIKVFDFLIDNFKRSDFRFDMANLIEEYTNRQFTI